MIKVEKDYEEFLKLLKKHKVKYCIVGAYALAFYVSPRYTKDMDIFVEQSWGNAKAIVKVLREFGFGDLKLSEHDFMAPGSIFQLGYEPIRIDLLTHIDGCSFERVWKSRKPGRYGRTKVFFISLNELIRNKKVSGRTQDQADLELIDRHSLKARKKPI